MAAHLSSRGTSSLKRDTTPAVRLRVMTCILLLILFSTVLANAAVWSVGHVEAGLADGQAFKDVSTSAFPSVDQATPLTLSHNLRILAQGDWLNARRTSFLATQSADHDHRVLQLWQNSGDGEALVHVWSSAPIPSTTSNTDKAASSPSAGHSEATTSPFIVSAVCGDLLRRGVLDVLVQASDGQLYFLDGVVLRLGVEAAMNASVALQPLPVWGSDQVNTALQRPAAPLVSLVTLRSPCHAPDVAFVNSDNALVLLSSVTRNTPMTTAAAGELQFSESSCAFTTVPGTIPTVLPVYEARYLFDDRTQVSWRDTAQDTTSASASSASSSSSSAVLRTTAFDVISAQSPELSIEDPFSLALQDVNEDCGAELVFTINHLQTDAAGARTGQDYVAAYSPHTNVITLLLALPTSMPDSEESLHFGTPLVTDVNGDGLVDLVLPARLSESDNDLPQGTFKRLLIAFNGRANVSANLGGNCADASAENSARVLLGVAGAPSSSLPNLVDVPIFSLSHSTLYSFSTQTCGLSASGGPPLAFSQLQMSPTAATAPLLLRDGDVNRDHLTDFVVPSNYGPLLLTSLDTHNAKTSAAPHVSSHTSHAFLCAPLDATLAEKATEASDLQHADGLQYLYSTPFFSTLGTTPGQLYVVLSLLDPAMTLTATRTLRAEEIASVSRAFRVMHTPPQRYFSQLAVTTREKLEQSAVASTGARSSDKQPSWTTQPLHGVLQVGAVHRFGWQDTHMTEHWATTTQASRSLGHDLSLARPLLGLGSTFSYVHDYTVGCVVAQDASNSSSKQTANVTLAPVVLHKQWPAYLVPNSQLFAAQTPAEQVDKWTLKLYLPTSQYRTLLLVTLAIILVVLGVPIACLRWREIRSDYKEWHNRL